MDTDSLILAAILLACLAYVGRKVYRMVRPGAGGAACGGGCGCSSDTAASCGAAPQKPVES
ncbi:FeoB-associated Cys-rich membrane protein [Magnetospira sp. QH-2]|uniref:FeoB-associated Cys-rich membrane protein n=1 Tax=Magnetospira sp. (strain QH-2) TaxID=1288970 RepID=UPI0003E812AB|nr:FeoB-associated Cys-rich membrane protein [Magnetospira sp. QH-2]CCQ74904.1 conserved protein of unknown function [Magnetospira sp. QH-2]